MHKPTLALRGFVVGSSLPATLWPLAGLGYNSLDLPAGTLNWLFIGLFFPLLFGITNAATVLLPGHNRWRKMFVIGALMAWSAHQSAPSATTFLKWSMD